MKRIILLIASFCVCALAGAQSKESSNSTHTTSLLSGAGSFVRPAAIEEVDQLQHSSKQVVLQGFTINPMSGEQELSYIKDPQMHILVNAPAPTAFNPGKPTKIVLYALPNGNTIQYTVGKQPEEGDDYRYHIQYIGAQTRALRKIDTTCNLVTIYLQAERRSWGSWRKENEGGDRLIKESVEEFLAMFSEYNPHIEMCSHSGGGNYIFGFIQANEEIPSYVTRITFIDSNYYWQEDLHGDKLSRWLSASPENHLFIACYQDYKGLLDGKHFVSKKGGTWTQTKLMRKCLKRGVTGVRWGRTRKDGAIIDRTKDGRILIYSKKNPDHLIYHTVFVEKNGYIHSVLFNTPLEERDYRFMGERIYDDLR